MDHVRIDDVQARLTEQGMASASLQLAGGGSLLVCERGGRLMPFGADGESVLWLSPALAQRERFAAFHARGDWNLGGERVWIAPEIQFTIHDRRDFWGSYSLPAAMDPGTWRLESSGDGDCALRQEAELAAHNLATGVKRLRVERRVRSVADPLRSLSEGAGADVAFMGYEHDTVVRDLEPNAIGAQSWNLIQLVPGGSVFVPLLTPVVQRDYFEPVGEERQRLSDDLVELSITGAHRYKVGYGSAHHLGRVGYVRALDASCARLLVRAFFNNPSTRYLEEPASKPGENGDSVHVYNDDGNAGGFGEIECYGQALGGEGGRVVSSDTTVLWMYTGAFAGVAQVARMLLGAAAGRRVTRLLGVS